MEICRFSRQPKANQFMDWVWDIVEKYRNNESTITNHIDMVPITEAITSMSQAITTLTSNMTTIQQDIQDLKQSYRKQLPVKKYSRWKTNTFRKLNTLLAYVNDNSDDELSLPNIIHLVIGETEDIYNIEINEYADLYRCEFYIGTDVKVQVLDVINHYKDIRDMFTLTLDSIMEKLHIAEETDCNGSGINRTRNIFDELAVKVEKDLEK